MAKRKAARARGRKTAGKRAAPLRKASAGQARRRKGAARKTQARRRRVVARKGPRGGGASAGKTAGKSAARKRVTRQGTARKAIRKPSTLREPQGRPEPRRGAAGSGWPRASSRGKVPALDRERRTIRDEDDLVPTPPSSLDLDRSASAVGTGRRELHEKFAQHTETSPVITGGDIDADWESAYSVGDEAPGGDNPTPDQDIVDDIGKALGVQYEDNEELKGEKKISDRDKKRWELDPASSDDYEDR